MRYQQYPIQDPSRNGTIMPTRTLLKDFFKDKN